MNAVRSKRAGWRVARALAIAPLMLLTACEERVISDHPFLSGVPGAVANRPTTGVPGAREQDSTPNDKLVLQKADGKKVLVAKTGRQLMVHIYNTLKNNDPDLFTDQVLSDVTRNEFIQRGLDPKEAFRELKRREEDVDALFAQIPMGEATPGAIVTNQGRKTLRIELTGMAAKGMRWSGMDIVMEHGNFKLRWFVDGPPLVD